MTDILLTNPGAEAINLFNVNKFINKLYQFLSTENRKLYLKRSVQVMILVLSSKFCLTVLCLELQIIPLAWKKNTKDFKKKKSFFQYLEPFSC